MSLVYLLQQQHHLTYYGTENQTQGLVHARQVFTTELHVQPLSYFKKKISTGIVANKVCERKL